MGGQVEVLELTMSDVQRRVMIFLPRVLAIEEYVNNTSIVYIEGKKPIEVDESYNTIKNILENLNR